MKKQWMLDDGYTTEELTEERLRESFDDMEDDEEAAFAVIVPPEDVRLCNFMQFAKSEDEEGYYAEISLPQKDDRSFVYGKAIPDEKGIRDLLALLCEHETLPDLTEWEFVGDFGPSLYVDSYRKLIRVLTDDEAIIREADELIDEPDLYFERHTNRNELRFFFPDIRLDEIIWLGLLDVLFDNGLVHIFQRHGDIIDFYEGIYALKALPQIDKSQFDEYAPVLDRLKMLDDMIKDTGLCLAVFDYDSFGYPVFVNTSDKIAEASLLASESGHRIIPVNVFDGYPDDEDELPNPYSREG